MQYLYSELEGEYNVYLVWKDLWKREQEPNTNYSISPQ